MKRSKRNIDEMGAYSDLLLYAIFASLFAFFVGVHAICTFIITGFETSGFVGDWSSALSSNLLNWGIIRWTVGIPVIAFAAYFIYNKLSLRKIDSEDIEDHIYVNELKAHNGCAVVRIFDINKNAYLDALYDETVKMCHKAGIKMPRLFYVDCPDLNGYTTTAKDGTNGIVLYRGIMDSMSLRDVKAVIAHELGHIISKDVAYEKWIGCAIGTMTSLWVLGHFLVEDYAERLLHPNDGGDPNPVEWLGGVLSLILGDILIMLGGFSNFCGFAIRWMRSKQAEYIADSRGACLLDDEQDFADMIIILHCSLVAQCPKLLCGPRNVARSESSCPGMKFATLDPHPNDVDRVRRIRPSFDGNFKRAYQEIVAKRKLNH